MGKLSEEEKKMSENAIKKKNTAGRFFSAAGKWAVLVGSPFVILLGVLYLFVFDPLQGKNILPPCYSLEFFGFYCAGCGNTRALSSLLHFDFLGVLRYNILSPVMFFLLGWLFLGEYLRLLFGKRVLWFPKDFKPWWVWTAIGITVLFTIFRNIPFFPFTLLAPG